MTKMIGRQRASSQPNLLKYCTQSLDVSIQATLSLPPQEEQPTLLRRRFSLAWDRGVHENPVQRNEGDNTPHLVKSQSCCRQHLSVPRSQQQTVSLPHHGRLHRQLTPHVCMAHPVSAAAESCSTSVKETPVRRQRSFLLVSPGPSAATASQGIGDMAGSMSSCSGLSSELTNAIEHQSNSIRSSIDSRRSNVTGMRRSCSFPNSLDMSRSSAEGPREELELSLLNSIGSAASSRDRAAMATHYTSATQARVMAEVRAWAAPTSASTEAAEAGSKLTSGSSLRFTSTPSHVSEKAPSVPSCVMSACASDDCLARASEGSAKSHGVPQSSALPVLSTLGESSVEKRNSQLLAASNGGVHKARDSHCSNAAPRRSCGSLDVARQVQLYTGNSSSAPGSAAVIPEKDSQSPAPQPPGPPQVHSHALTMSSLLFQPAKTANVPTVERPSVPAAVSEQNVLSQPTPSGKATHPQSTEVGAQTTMIPTGVRTSDVSEGGLSTCSTVFGSPVPVCGLLLEKDGQHPCPIPEGSEAKVSEEASAHSLVFSSALFQTAQRVPAYPCTQRGGIPADTTKVLPPAAVGGSLGPNASPLISPVRETGSADASGDLGSSWERCRHRQRFTEPTTSGASPRTSSDPARRPSADVAFETDLEMRVARSRQTMDFAARQRIRFGTLSRAQLTIMDALALMDTLPRTNGQQAASQSATAYALLCAQWCVHEFPGQDWAPLVGLMHDLGRLLLHPKFGSEPAWCVTSESYPLGCRFSESISGYFFLHACPDRRCSAYAKPTGIYSSHCGLDAIHFTWTAPEYLSLVASQNGGRLPFPAMFLLRYQSFESAITEGAYSHLMNEEDVRCLPLLRKFTAVRRAAEGGAGPPRACSHSEVIARCSAAMKKYFPQPQLRF